MHVIVTFFTCFSYTPLIHIIGTKLLLNVRFDQYTTPARQGDKMLRLLCFNFAEDSAAGSNSNKPASSSGSSSSQQGLDAVGLLGTSAVTPITSAVLTPQTYLLKTKESKVSVQFLASSFSYLMLCFFVGL